MQLHGIRGSEMTPAERFEDSHRRLGLRNRISNALMAIALFEVKSKSENLDRYISDGLGVSRECVSSLNRMAENYSTYQYRDYTSKVLLDILTDRLNREVDKKKLETYERGFSDAQRAFEAIEQRREPDPGMVRTAEQVMREIDREIESTYAQEESLYRGSFISR